MAYPFVPSTVGSGKDFSFSNVASKFKRQISSRTAVRSVASHRRFYLEPLEPRLLLSADLAPGAAQALADGLDGLANWADELDDFDELSQPLPLIDTPLSELLDLGDLIQDHLVTPLQSAVAGATETADIATAIDEALDALLGAGDYVTDMTDGLTPGEYRFSVDFTYEIGQDFDFGAGAAFDALSLDFDNQISLLGSIDVSFEFGLDLTGGLDPADAFFIDVSDVDAGIQLAGIIDASIDTSFDLGFVSAAIVGGSVDMQAFLDVNLPDGGGDSLLSLAELNAASVDGTVLAVSTDSVFAATLPVVVTLPDIDGIGDDILNSALTITGINPANLFSLPDFDISVDSDTLKDFTNIKPGDVVGMLSSLGAQLDNLSSLMDVADGIPFIGEAISDISNYTEMLREMALTLFDVGVNAISPLADLNPLSGVKTFEISVDGAGVQVISLDFDAISTPQQLLDALNQEFTDAGIALEATLEQAQLQIKAIDDSIQEFDLSNVDDEIRAALGLEDTMFGLPLFQFATIQEFVTLLNNSVLLTLPVEASYDTSNNSITFNLNLAKSFSESIVLDFNKSIDLGIGDLVLAGGAAGSFDVSAGLELGAGIDLSTFTGDTTIGELNGGLGVRTIAGDDLMLQLSDGTSWAVNLSGLSNASTVQNLIDLIVAGSGSNLSIDVGSDPTNSGSSPNVSAPGKTSGRDKSPDVKAKFTVPTERNQLSVPSVSLLANSLRNTRPSPDGSVKVIEASTVVSVRLPS